VVVDNRDDTPPLISKTDIWEAHMLTFPVPHEDVSDARNRDDEDPISAHG
jgi:hypothetical protein